MGKILAALLGLLAFLVVCIYWIWQILSGRPALNAEDVALRALVAMVIAYLVGRFLARLCTSILAESCQEAEVRRRDREMLKAMTVRDAIAEGGGQGDTEAGRDQ